MAEARNDAYSMTLVRMFLLNVFTNVFTYTKKASSSVKSSKQ